jgi:hypothetical protein
VVAATVAADPGPLIDLNGRLGPEVEGLAGYRGVLW